MLPLNKYIILSLFCFTYGSISAEAQTTQNEEDVYSLDWYQLNQYKWNDSTKLYSNDKFVPTCKDPQLLQFLRSFSKPELKVYSVPKTKFLAIHGSVNYDFLYRSKLDTPFAQENLQQHTERVNLEILCKDKYPVRFSIAARQSNSPFFRNFMDANFQLDRYKYTANLKQQLIDKLQKELPQLPNLVMPQNVLDEKLNQYLLLKKWVNSTATLQKIIEEREQNAAGQWSGIRTIPSAEVEMQGNIATPEAAMKNVEQLFGNSRYKKIGNFTMPKINREAILAKANVFIDSAKKQSSSFIDLYNKKKTELEKLEQELKVLQFKKDSLTNNYTKTLQAYKQKIYQAKDEKELKNIAKEAGVKLNPKEKLEKLLTGIKTIGIGRSMLNYSELTAQNITITGLNVEYNTKNYAAISAGKIDYRFRDFFNANYRNSNNKQYLVMGRLGIGDIEKRAIIFSLLQGRKSTSQFGLADSSVSNVNIMSYAVEGIWKKDANTFLSAEIAKSTKPITGNLTTNKGTNALLDWNDHSNLGVNVKAQTQLTKTHTYLSGFYRKTGANFQSFSLFTYNTNQEAWLLKAQQSFLKNKISLTGIIRQNDFTNPFTDKTFKTNTTFKSGILNIRFPKYPMLSLGYYPATQLYIVNTDRIRENAYYILNGSLVYNYLLKGKGMNTTVVYNKFINNATDSGFVYYKGINYLISQTIILPKLQLKEDYSYTKQPELTFYTLESSLDFSIGAKLKLGAGIKYNKVDHGDSYIGGRGLLYADLKQFGVFQLQYEKSYLPTITNVLFPIEMGRISWFKTF